MKPNILQSQPSNTRSSTTVLAGDIGGTKTNLSLFSGLEDDMKLLSVRTYPSQDAPSPNDLIARFLREEGEITINEACFGVAGPVINGVAKAVNLPWDVDETAIRNHFNFKRVEVINDLVAMILSIPHLTDDQILPLNGCPLPPTPGNIGLIAAGTGLGEALMIWDGMAYTPCPSEGGHKDFAPRTALEIRLLNTLTEKYGHVSFDRILSGRGLPDIYNFLLNESGTDTPEWLKSRFSNENPSAVISSTGLANEDPICRDTLSLFTRVYGSEAGNLALQGVTLGGMYIGGGIAPKIAEMLSSDIFLEAFSDKGRLKPLLDQIPLRLIVDPQAPLWGAAAAALKK